MVFFTEEGSAVSRLVRLLMCVFYVISARGVPQEGGLSLLLTLAQPPAGPSAAVEEEAEASPEGLAASGTGDWEVFALAVKLLRRSCMLSANRSDLLSLKASACLCVRVSACRFFFFLWCSSDAVCLFSTPRLQSQTAR